MSSDAGTASRDAWMPFALDAAALLGPLAAQYGLLVVIVPPAASDSGQPEILSIDRDTGVRRCVGCGNELLEAVAGSTVLGNPSDAERLTVVMRAVCSTCMPAKRKAT